MIKKLIFYSSLFVVLTGLTLYPQQKSIFKYKVTIDLGTDSSDPLFSDFFLRAYLKQRVSERLPEFGYSDLEDANVFMKLTLLTQTGSEINNRFASALNLLITSSFHSPLNWNLLIIESKEEFAQERIKDFIDRWILEYSAYIYKSTKNKH